MEDNGIQKLLLEIKGDVKEIATEQKGMAAEQHDIKNDIEKIAQKLDVTQKKTDDNSKDIEFINTRFEEYKAETEKKHERIYVNMDKKESLLIKKIDERSESDSARIKSWIIRGIGTAIGTPIILYLIMKLLEK